MRLLFFVCMLSLFGSAVAQEVAKTETLETVQPYADAVRDRFLKMPQGTLQGAAMIKALQGRTEDPVKLFITDFESQFLTPQAQGLQGWLTEYYIQKGMFSATDLLGMIQGVQQNMARERLASTAPMEVSTGVSEVSTAGEIVLE